MKTTLFIPFGTKQAPGADRSYGAQCAGGADSPCDQNLTAAPSPFLVDGWMVDHATQSGHRHYLRTFTDGGIVSPDIPLPDQDAPARRRPFATPQDPEVCPTYAAQCQTCDASSGLRTPPQEIDRWMVDHATQSGHQHYLRTSTDATIVVPNALPDPALVAIPDAAAAALDGYPSSTPGWSI